MRERYLPIDLLRGASVALMIVVNMPGSWGHVYSPLRHAGWHGCTAADLVFPLFLFITGFSMAFSMSGRGPGKARTGDETKALHLKILRRCLVIFAIGLFLNIFPFSAPLSEIRVLGVLQRIALAWGLAALTVLHLRKRHIAVLSLAVLVSYYLMSLLLGGAEPWSLDGNLAVRVDLALLGEGHMWKGLGSPFEPEGILSTIPATVSVLAGFIAGAPAASGLMPESLVKRYLLAGAGLAAAGWSLGPVYPVNKPLWTGSYVLLTTGASMVLMAGCIWTTEIRRWRRWAAPAAVFGMNPLLAFILSGLWARTLGSLIRTPDGETGYTWLYSTVFRPVFGASGGSLAFALFHLLLFWVFILLLVHRRGIVVKA